MTTPYPGKMTSRIHPIPPRFLARMTGLFSLFTILTGIFAQGSVSERLIDFSNAAATATNILTHKGLFQLGFTVYIIEMTCRLATVSHHGSALDPILYVSPEMN